MQGRRITYKLELRRSHSLSLLGRRVNPKELKFYAWASLGLANNFATETAHRHSTDHKNLVHGNPFIISSFFAFDSQQRPRQVTKMMQSTYDPLSAVVETNNMVTSHFRDSSYDEVIKKLSSSLAILKDVAKMQEANFLEQRQEADHSVASGPLCDFALSEGSSHAIASKSNAKASRNISHGRLPYVFRRPISLSHQVLQSHKSIEYLSYVLIFNLALAQHLKCIDNDLTAGLQKAIALYQYAQKLLVTHDLDVSLLHTLAISNNLGHAHYSMNNESSAKVCFERLLMVIMYITESGDSGKELARNLPLDGFFRNVMPLLAAFCAAPAA